MQSYPFNLVFTLRSEKIYWSMWRTGKFQMGSLDTEFPNARRGLSHCSTNVLKMNTTAILSVLEFGFMVAPCGIAVTIPIHLSRCSHPLANSNILIRARPSKQEPYTTVPDNLNSCHYASELLRKSDGKIGIIDWTYLKFNWMCKNNINIKFYLFLKKYCNFSILKARTCNAGRVSNWQKNIWRRVLLDVSVLGFLKKKKKWESRV